MTQTLLVVVPAFLAALLSYVLTPPVRRLAVRLRAIDTPDARKVHTRPIPRMGGLAVVVSAISVIALVWVAGFHQFNKIPSGLLAALGLGLLPILFVSVWDDMRRLPAWAKFIGHGLGAAIAIWWGVRLNPDVHLFGVSIYLDGWALPISFLWLVGLTSAFNLVDGLDGLSAGLALISCGTLVGVFLIAGSTSTASLALVLAGAVVGFLPWNMFPARIFLGDTGACALGFWLACLTLRGGSTLSAGFATMLPLLVLGLPVADTLLSILRRLISRVTGARSGVFEADRNHIHHRLLALGLDHRQAVLILYGVALLLAVAGLVSLMVTAHKAALLLLAVLLAGLVGIGRLGYQEFAVMRSGIVLRFYDAPMLRRSFFVVFADLVMIAVAVGGAVAIKYEDWLLAANRGAAITMFVTLAPVTVSVFWLVGLYRGTWRLASVDDFVRACYGVLAASFIGFVLLQLSSSTWFPVSLFLIYTLLKLALANGSRVSYRVFLRAGLRGRRDQEPVIIYGAGQRGMTMVRELGEDAESRMRPVGFIDDNAARVGHSLNGVPILATADGLARAIRDTGARVVVVSSDDIGGVGLAKAERACRAAKVRLLRMTVRFEPIATVEVGPIEGTHGEADDDVSWRAVSPVVASQAWPDAAK
jgi:UDP-GlcNAc:undecaprenyl-phosphate/decaprenyl-phosphate GlcNAc-1-phosphate transferase